METDYYDKLIAYLKDKWCYLVRQGKGSHEIWFSPITNRHFPVAYTIHSRSTANGGMKISRLGKALLTTPFIAH